ncbi:MAG: hypothetical protein AAF496_17155, partial [Pseudomonadota bacterium]
MIDFIRKTIVASVFTPALMLPSNAQPLTWSDILSPDRLIESLARYAIVMARTQVDLTFEDISTNLLSNRTTISGLKIWPGPPWRDGGLCNLSIERVTISGQAFDNLDNARVKIDFFDAEISPTC